MSTVTPNRQSGRPSEPGAHPAMTSTNPMPNTMDNNPETKHQMAATALLTAKQSRQMKKLELVHPVILSQEPLAIIPLIIDFASSMTEHHEKIHQRFAAIANSAQKMIWGTLCPKECLHQNSHHLLRNA